MLVKRRLLNRVIEIIALTSEFHFPLLLAVEATTNLFDKKSKKQGKSDFLIVFLTFCCSFLFYSLEVILIAWVKNIQCHFKNI